MLRNDFDIDRYLAGNGFFRADVRTYIHQDPQIKVKLIHPNKMYSCGYSTMAITSPDRKFKKLELEVPRDMSRANRLFFPLMNYRAGFDDSFDSTFETQGTVTSEAKEIGSRIWISIRINKADRPAGFIIRKSNDQVIEQLNESRVNDMVHIVFKVLPGAHPRLEITGIQILN